MLKTISVQVKENPICIIPDIIYSQPSTYFGYTGKTLKMHFLRYEEDFNVREKIKRPTIVWCIGGAFRETAPLKAAPNLIYLATAGYNVALIDYRVCTEGTFPAAVQDVKTAIRFLRAHAEQYGVDENRIAVMGDSAGGYLSVMTGVTAGVEMFETKEWAGYDSSVKAVVDFYGPTNMIDMIDNPENQYFAPEFKPEIQFLGPDKELWNASNPLSYISEQTPPFLIFHGTIDEQVPCSQSKKLYEELEKKGVPVDFYMLEDALHARAEFWQDEIKEIVLKFLNDNL